jgi:hypothetical protein
MAGVQVTDTQLQTLRATLLNTSGKTQLHERFRALFMLKAVGGDEVVRIISEGTFLCLHTSHMRIFSSATNLRAKEGGGNV